jgi:hypothetical protein
MIPPVYWPAESWFLAEMAGVDVSHMKPPQLFVMLHNGEFRQLEHNCIEKHMIPSTNLSIFTPRRVAAVICGHRHESPQFTPAKVQRWPATCCSVGCRWLFAHYYGE